MPSIKTLLLVALLVFSSFSGTAQASIGITIQCFECTPQQMLLKAENAISYLHAPPAYVVDWNSGTVRKYVTFSNVTPEWNPEFDPLIIWTEEVPAESVVVSNIAAARATYPAVFLRPHTGIEVDGSAFYVIDSQHAENDLLEYVQEYFGPGGVQDVHDILAEVLVFMEPEFTVRVFYSDGTSVIVQYLNGEWSRVEGEAKDARGNKIPEKRVDFTDGGIETFIFNGAGDIMAQIFYERAEEMGINIQPPDVNRRFGYVCAMGPGDTITCIIQIL